MTQERVNPFQKPAGEEASLDSLDDFTTKRPPATRPSSAMVDAVAEAAGFPSRDPQKPKQQRRYRTGRNLQMNLKVSKTAQDLFFKLVDEMEQPQGLVFEQAVQALAEKRGVKGP